MYIDALKLFFLPHDIFKEKLTILNLKFKVKLLKIQSHIVLKMEFF